MIPLSKSQSEIMKEFYECASEKVIFDKKQRESIWNKTKRKEKIDLLKIEQVCPALAHQIKKSYENGKNIQSAVFSECVYAQTFANILKLNRFVNCSENATFIPEKVNKLLKSYYLVPRYAYCNKDGSRMLIQAGGCNGVDSALITVIDLCIYTIEFKEPGAKTSEPDLPKYREDGDLLITKEFLNKYPQFEMMLNEHKGLNFFKVMGKNINDFSPESVNIAVTNNYTKKYADVVCTEDKNGYLVMIPTNQISQWASKIEGEIRPAGRNCYKVWTPKYLKSYLLKNGAIISDSTVTMPLDKMAIRKPRGGNRKISGYKINPLFFVYVKNCTIENEKITFDFNSVRQLNPTIAGKMFFGTLEYEKVKKHYF